MHFVLTPFDCKDENSFFFSLFVDVRFKFCCVLLIWIKHSLLFRKTIEPPLTVTSPQRPSTATRLQWPFFFSWRTVHTLTLVLTSLQRGGSRIFFRRGCTRLLRYFNTNKPHSLFCRKPVVLENRRSSRGVGVCTPCTLPLDPPLLSPR